MQSKKIIASIARRTRNLTDPEVYTMGLPLPALDLPRDILLMRRSPKRHPTTIPLMHADKFLLVLTLRGCGTTVNDHLALRLQPCRALLIFPRQFHHFTGLTGRDFLWFFCSFRLACHQDIIMLKNTPVPIAAHLWPAIQALITDYSDARRMRPRMLGRIAVNLWALLLDLADAAAIHPDVKSIVPPYLDRNMQFLEKLQNYLVDRLHEKIGVEQMAAHMSMSRRSLYQQFQAVMRIGLAEYIQRLRIQKAASLMNTTDLTISQIAEQTGYTSVFSFSRAFKRATHLAPSDYRALHAPR